jgi:hypothetical protein
VVQKEEADARDNEEEEEEAEARDNEEEENLRRRRKKRGRRRGRLTRRKRRTWSSSMTACAMMPSPPWRLTDAPILNFSTRSSTSTTVWGMVPGRPESAAEEGLWWLLELVDCYYKREGWLLVVCHWCERWVGPAFFASFLSHLRRSAIYEANRLSVPRTDHPHVAFMCRA